MPSSYSQYKIELQVTGENSGTWGTITNANFGSATPGVYQGFEQAIGGRADVTMSTTTVTLTLTNTNAAQDARALYLNLSGTPGGAADLVVPALQKAYLVKNGTNAVVTIKVTGQTGVPIPVGRTVWVYNNGTDVVTAVDHIPSLTLGAALLPASGGTGITSLGTGVATWLGTPSSANLAAAVTDETGTGALVFANSPTLVTPALGTPSSATLTNATGLPTAGLVDNAVTDVKLRDSAGLSVIGRSANSTGDPADIAAGTDHQVLRRSGTSIGFGAVALNQANAITGTLPVGNGGTGITSFGTGVATALGQNVTGSGGIALATSPSFTTPTLGAASATSVAFGAGAVGTPSITTTGDTDTGIYFPGADRVGIVTGGSQRVEVNASGNVGIGTSTPDIDSLGSGYRILTIFGVASADTAGVLNLAAANSSSGFTDTGRIHFFNGTNRVAQIVGRTAGANNDSCNLSFSTQATGGSLTERARITSGGDFLVGIATARANAGDVQVSKGISFPATQSAQSDANTLDDYEEGTWTPVFTTLAGTAPTGVTYSVQVGRYTKIGNIAFISGAITLSSKGTGGSGTTRISGLPFTVANITNLFIGFGMECDTLDSDQKQINAVPIVNDTIFAVNGGSGSTGAAAAVPYSAITNTTVFRFGFFYQVA